jgi:hypothetical protein
MHDSASKGAISGGREYPRYPATAHSPDFRRRARGAANEKPRPAFTAERGFESGQSRLTTRHRSHAIQMVCMQVHLPAALDIEGHAWPEYSHSGSLNMLRAE